ncbi:helix-turn-helix domain-containing protein [Mannheimia sp. AT1]|uniref:Helix-turn-helix domain-containing protein n=1 Tax=Mannheimia cairinae TaxID=3025936 RepID=A0ABT5MQ00_9PAST|nr:helix-turn-helix domain-containing protein [Mannheimia cairinae]MDD0822923.1 helix-turn-helix domain-containing protein [Mannheimia cairinae]MDD0826049.1 helix-turn-helix domain-containing protein [Mannheimia cairinae]
MLNAPHYQNISSLDETGFGYALSLIGGKYKMVILFWLYLNPPNMRFNELQRKIGKISVKTLSQSLKELENDGLIIRTEYPQIPPKVEYSLSDKGLSLMPILDNLCEWGEQYR